MILYLKQINNLVYLMLIKRKQTSFLKLLYTKHVGYLFGKGIFQNMVATNFLWDAHSVKSQYLYSRFSLIQVLLYATALNEVVEEDGIEAKSDGEKIIKRMWNRTITGMSSQCLYEKLELR